MPDDIEARLRKLEAFSHKFPPDMFAYFQDDARWKQTVSDSLNALLSKTTELGDKADTNLRHSDDEDDGIMQALNDHQDGCPMIKKFSDFIEKDYTPFKEKVLDTSWILGLLKPAAVAIVTFVALEAVKRAVGM